MAAEGGEIRAFHPWVSVFNTRLGVEFPKSFFLPPQKCQEGRTIQSCRYQIISPGGWMEVGLPERFERETSAKQSNRIIVILFLLTKKKSTTTTLSTASWSIYNRHLQVYHPRPQYSLHLYYRK